MGHPKQLAPQPISKKDSEANIAILNALTPSGKTWTIREIADITGCSRGMIVYITNQAFDKIKNNPMLRQYAHDLAH